MKQKLLIYDFLKFGLKDKENPKAKRTSTLTRRIYKLILLLQNKVFLFHLT